VDKRTDIWAFGALLYEMLAGRKPFHGKTVPHILVHTMEQTPDRTKLPPRPAGPLGSAGTLSGEGIPAAAARIRRRADPATGDALQVDGPW
jgi:serine/threonine protein kinase